MKGIMRAADGSQHETMHGLQMHCAGSTHRSQLRELRREGGHQWAREAIPGVNASGTFKCSGGGASDGGQGCCARTSSGATPGSTMVWLAVRAGRDAASLRTSPASRCPAQRSCSVTRRVEHRIPWNHKAFSPIKRLVRIEPPHAVPAVTRPNRAGWFARLHLLFTKGMNTATERGPGAGVGRQLPGS